MSRILLSLDDRYYPYLPIECLKSEHEVIILDRSSLSSSEVSLPDIPFDLCIVDEPTFDRVQPLVGDLKRASAPIFLPFLLVVNHLKIGKIESQFTAKIKGLIDDAIFLPIEPLQLQLRVDSLLECRRLSLELHKLQEAVERAIDRENLLLDSLQAADDKLQREIAKQAQIEVARQRENSYLDSLMNAMPDIVCFKDGSGRWQEANQAMLDLFELGADEYRGLKDVELGELSPFYLEALRYCEMSDRMAWEKGTLSRGEEVIPRSDGSVKIYDTIKVPLFDSDSQRKSIVILGRDITERKQAQEELLRLASIVESSGDGIVGKTPDGTIQSWNAGAEKIYGYSAAEVKGRSIEILAVPDRPDEIRQILANIRSGASIDHYETVHLRKDGKQIDVSLTISPIQDAAGAIIGVSTIARDITDKKRVEKALEQLRHQNELILFSAGEGICGLNKSGKVTFVNPAAVRMAGYSGKELLERPLWDSLHRKSEKTHKTQQENLSLTEPNSDTEIPRACPSGSADCQVLATLQDGKARRVTDEVFWRPDGTSFPVEYVVTPMREGGEIIGAVVTFKDITDRLAIDRMKDEFISVVSHELRTPMTSIHGALGLLNSGLLAVQPDKAKRMLEIAVTNTERLVRLIDDILDLERMESSCDSAVKEICSAAELMQQAADAMQGMALQAGVTLSVTPANARLPGTPDRLIQTLTNLLSNAIKFSPAGATVSLSSELIVKQDNAAKQHGTIPNSELRIAVKDRGRGIPADKLEIIFERFQQVDASDCRNSGGTGLGLAICRSIVQQHGGRIWVESVLGEGSTFFLTLPAIAGGESQVG